MTMPLVRHLAMAACASLAVLTLSVSPALAQRSPGPSHPADSGSPAPPPPHGFQDPGAGSGAGYTGPRAGFGFNGPGPDASTVGQIQSAPDKARVALRGNIVQYLGGKHYLFRDPSGDIQVTMGPKELYGLTFDDKDTMIIYGKIKRDWNKFEVKVDNIFKAPS